MIFVAACTTAKEKPEPISPFLASEVSFADSIDRICMTATRPEIDKLIGQEHLDRFDQMIADYLRANKFDVVEKEVAATTLEAVAQREGGYFDPATGEINPDRYRRIHDLARVELSESTSCGAFVKPRVMIVQAPWIEGIARWDGAREGIQNYRLSRMYGWTSAFSLWVEIEDISGQTIYFRTGGLKLIVSPSLLVRGNQRVPRVDLAIASRKRNEAAIRRALEPLVERFSETR